MKWKTIKDKCVREAWLKMKETDLTLISLACMLDDKYKKLDPTTTHRRSIHKELTEEVFKLIDNWDIRNYGKLKDIFPNCFPKVVNFVGMGENGEWELTS